MPYNHHDDAVLAVLDAPMEEPGHPAVRLELICRIREMIASGQYETEERLQVALDKLLDSMM
jgi:hypothetical protein